MANDIVSAKLMLLQCSTLLNEIVEASYLKGNGESYSEGSTLYSKLLRIIDSFANIKNDGERQALLKRYFNYEFPFYEVERTIAELEDDESKVDLRTLRGILREYNKAISDKEGITRH